MPRKNGNAKVRKQRPREQARKGDFVARQHASTLKDPTVMVRNRLRVQQVHQAATR